MRDYLRQLEILDPKEIIFPATVIGLGQIGRPTAETLVEMGFKEITLIDPDRVEPHNLPNQGYREKDVGKLKVEATKEIIKEFVADCKKVETIPGEFKDQELEGIVISGVDSMEARKTIWEKIKWNLKIPLYIDGRIAGEVLQIFTVRPCQIEDIEIYEKTLFSDEEASELPCGARGIAYIGKAMAALISNQVKKFLKKERFYRKITFDLKTMTLLLQDLTKAY